MKIKLFGKEGSKKVLGLEAEVNTWLEQHPTIKIIDIRQSASGGSLQDTKLYISVWYEDA
ncbi:MAG: hypothetical protein JSW59_16515 [Phycisphaerales bacterium]|nr:MAG: hypothetical protein JSW59_16515 [Phycisphaerales bacterium]